MTRYAAKTIYLSVTISSTAPNLLPIVQKHSAEGIGAPSTFLTLTLVEVPSSISIHCVEKAGNTVQGNAYLGVDWHIIK